MLQIQAATRPVDFSVCSQPSGPGTMPGLVLPTLQTGMSFCSDRRNSALTDDSFFTPPVFHFPWSDKAREGRGKINNTTGPGVETNV